MYLCLLFLHSLLDSLKNFIWIKFFQIIQVPNSILLEKYKIYILGFSPSRVSIKIFLPKVWPSPGECTASEHQGLPLSCLLRCLFPGAAVTFWCELGTQGSKRSWRATVKLPRRLGRLANHSFQLHNCDSGLCFSEGENWGAGRWSSMVCDLVVEIYLGRTQIP
jgi:hypothetical protein